MFLKLKVKKIKKKKIKKKKTKRNFFLKIKALKLLFTNFGFAVGTVMWSSKNVELDFHNEHE